VDKDELIRFRGQRSRSRWGQMWSKTLCEFWRSYIQTSRSQITFRWGIPINGSSLKII